MTRLQQLPAFGCAGSEHPRNWPKAIGFWLGWVTGILLPILAGPAAAQEPGESVVVVTEAPLKVRDDVVGTLYPGTIHKVTQVNGKWLALEAQRGWLDKTFTRSMVGARDLYRQRVATNPNDLAALSALGSIYRQLEEYPASIEAYNRALQVDSRKPQLFNNRGLTLIAQGRKDLAEKDFQAAIKLAPKYAQAYANLGWLYFTTDRIELAVQQYNQALNLEQDNPTFYINRGGCFRELGRLDDAMRDFVRAVELAGNVPDGFVGQSAILMEKLEFPAAIAAADRALELDPTNLQAIINRGWAKHLQGDSPAALEDLNQAIAWEQGSLLARLNRSAVLLELQQYDQARADLVRAEELDDQHPGVWLNWGELYWQQRQFADALQAYEKSVRLGPELAEGQNGLAWFYATCPEDGLRKAAEAVRLATAACRSSQNKDWSHLDTLAAAHANLGDFAEALRAAEAALKLAPENKKAPVQHRLDGYRQNQPYRF
jgi:tetratricopeptide (TPR) repeat protein